MVNDALEFSVVGVPGYTYRVDASTNLNDWREIVTNRSPFSVTNPLSPGDLQQFFRARY